MVRKTANGRHSYGSVTATETVTVAATATYDMTYIGQGQEDLGANGRKWRAAYGREGENPELRTLFFRCIKLLSRPFLPLFVFDGPLRPELKREKRVSGNDHWLVSGMKSIIEAFGFEWRVAPGEAEAELAYLNRIGVIDAIVTDDVDTFVFGATKVIRK